MNEISISNYDLSTMCRLCLTRDCTKIDIFRFSSKMRDEVVAVIMKCVPVQITKGDEMPKFICQVCYTQLEQIHQFQMKAVQSEKKLRQYLQQIHAFDKQITPECSIQKPIEEPLIHNYVADATVKCESFEFLDIDKKDKGLINFDKIYEEISMKSLVKDEPLDDYNLTSTECHNDTQCILPNNDGNDSSYEDSDINVNDSKLGENIDINWEAKESVNVNTRRKINEELSSKSKMKDESMKDNSSILTGNTLFKGDSSEINCKNTKIDVGPTSENLASSRSGDATKYFDNREEWNKNTSIIRLRHKKPCKMNSKCEKPYQCDVCNKHFTQAVNLNNHKRIHTGEKPYQCDVCNKCFSHSSNLHYHKRGHTGEKPYQCDVCNKCFSQSSNLNNHRRIHTGEKPYQCDVCNISFYDSSILSRHRRIHTGDKPYQCDVCKKCFSQASNLNNHKRIHTGEKPYQCSVCSASFYDSSILIRHKRIHTGEKPYLCDVCNKCFSKSDHLRIHKRIHTGEKPYQCDVCNKCFRNLSTLKRHQHVHTSEKPYQCHVGAAPNQEL